MEDLRAAIDDYNIKREALNTVLSRYTLNFAPPSQEGYTKGKDRQLRYSERIAKAEKEYHNFSENVLNPYKLAEKNVLRLLEDRIKDGTDYVIIDGMRFSKTTDKRGNRGESFNYYIINPFTEENVLLEQGIIDIVDRLDHPQTGNVDIAGKYKYFVGDFAEDHIKYLQLKKAYASDPQYRKNSQKTAFEALGKAIMDKLPIQKTDNFIIINGEKFEKRANYTEDRLMDLARSVLTKQTKEARNIEQQAQNTKVREEQQAQDKKLREEQYAAEHKTLETNIRVIFEIIGQTLVKLLTPIDIANYKMPGRMLTKDQIDINDRIDNLVTFMEQKDGMKLIAEYMKLKELLTKYKRPGGGTDKFTDLKKELYESDGFLPVLSDLLSQVADANQFDNTNYMSILKTLKLILGSNTNETTTRVNRLISEFNNDERQKAPVYNNRSQKSTSHNYNPLVKNFKPPVPKKPWYQIFGGRHSHKKRTRKQSKQSKRSKRVQTRRR